MSKIDELRNTTYEDMVGKLNVFKRCALIRPCSFGKTVMSVKLFQNYKKVLFLYPADCIKMMLETRHAAEINKNITFMSYNMLARMSAEEIANLPMYDLIFADEAHRLGGAKTKTAFFLLMNTQDEGTHFVGSTATPDRMDGFDFVKEFMDGIEVSPYSLHDAIKDGIIKKPYYYFCNLKPREEIEKNVKKAYTSMFKALPAEDEFQEIVSNIVESCNIFSVENIIKKVCAPRVAKKKYMKFICFFLHIEDIRENYKMIASWFEKALPGFRIRKTEIHSGNEALNVEVLEELKEEENTIDLIFTCDMLNEGYHVGDITGIVMLRKTLSNRIYNQQIGRCLSSDEKDNAKIIFDVVDNIHRPSLFKEGKGLLSDEDVISGYFGDEESGVEESQDEDGNNVEDNEDNNSTDSERKAKKPTSLDMAGINLPGYVYISGQGWYHNGKLDVSAHFFEALYMELINKTMIEKHAASIVAAIQEYQKRGFALFKDRKELARNSARKRALNYIAKAYNLPLDIIYAAVEAQQAA